MATERRAGCRCNGHRDRQRAAGGCACRGGGGLASRRSSSSVSPMIAGLECGTRCAAGTDFRTRVRFLRRALEVHGYVATTVRTLGAQPLRRRAVGSLAVVQHRQRRGGAEPVPERPRQVEILNFYVRAEVRYDCVWTRACGMFPTVNTYGDRAKQLPQPAHRRRRRRLHRRAEERRLAPRIEREPQQLPARESRRSPASAPLGAEVRPTPGLREPVRKRRRPQPGVRADLRAHRRRPAFLLLRQHPEALQVRRNEFARRRERSGLEHPRSVESRLRHRGERLASLPTESRCRWTSSFRSSPASIGSRTPATSATTRALRMRCPAPAVALARRVSGRSIRTAKGRCPIGRRPSALRWNAAFPRRKHRASTCRAPHWCAS